MHIAYHNLAGTVIWHSEIDASGSMDEIHALLQQSRASLVCWDAIEYGGVFSIGPLTGLVRITLHKPTALPAVEAHGMYHEYRRTGTPYIDGTEDNGQSTRFDEDAI